MTHTQPRTETDLKTAVTAELEWTPSVNAAHIGVAVHDTAVTLTGEVESYPEKRLAEQAALRVRGVTAVAEDMTVRSVFGSINDTDIARQAGEALERAIDVPADTVKVAVDNRFITLSGPVMWQFQREAAHRAVRYLKGVTGVRNTITILPSVSPRGIKNAIQAALVRDALLESKNIKVTDDAGVVTLEGTVHSWSERRQADAAAWSAPGVTGVKNHLNVGSEKEYVA